MDRENLREKVATLKKGLRNRWVDFTYFPPTIAGTAVVDSIEEGEEKSYAEIKYPGSGERDIGSILRIPANFVNTGQQVQVILRVSRRGLDKASLLASRSWKSAIRPYDREDPGKSLEPEVEEMLDTNWCDNKLSPKFFNFFVEPKIRR